MSTTIIRPCHMCGEPKRILARDCCAGCYQAMRRAGRLDLLPALPRGWQPGVKRQGRRGKAASS